MHRSLFFFAFFAAALFVCGMTSPAQAQATRTWVSGGGDDANVCSRSLPCRTFAGAAPKTAAGGEIDALDPANFNPVGITKALTIDGSGGQVGGVTSTSGPAIQINAGANDRVILRNLRINGISQVATTTSTNGIAFNSGLSLKVENCYIFGFNSYGINFQPSIRAVLTVTDTQVEGSGTFGGTFGGGIIVATPATTGGINRATLRNVTVSTSVSGITAGQNTKMQLDNVTVGEGGVGGGGDYGLIATGPAAEMNVDYSTISGNQFGGIHALSGGTIRVANSTISDNNTNGILIDAGGAVQSYGNNRVASNAGVFAFSAGTLPQT